MEKQKLVYEISWLIDLVYRESDRLARVIANTEKFEDRCIAYLGNYLAKSPKNKHKKKFLIKMIKRKSKEAIKEFRNELSAPFSSLERENEEGEIMEIEPEDVLANVEAEVIANNLTALLAQDGRTRLILETWKLGIVNGRYISGMLAHTLGGNIESHRKAIHRFKKDCRKRLAGAF